MNYKNGEISKDFDKLSCVFLHFSLTSLYEIALNDQTMMKTCTNVQFHMNLKK